MVVRPAKNTKNIIKLLYSYFQNQLQRDRLRGKFLGSPSPTRAIDWCHFCRRSCMPVTVQKYMLRISRLTNSSSSRPRNISANDGIQLLNSSSIANTIVLAVNCTTTSSRSPRTRSISLRRSLGQRSTRLQERKNKAKHTICWQ